MEDTSARQYMRDAIMTASPEQLQLMLFDGAIRFCMRAQDAIQAGHIEDSHNALTRAQRIMTEMENGLNHEVAPELCERMSALYAFVFSKLVDANINRDTDSLQDALKILKLQRETWAVLVDKVQRARADHGGMIPPDLPADGSDQPGVNSFEG